jgi:hypothetical protein
MRKGGIGATDNFKNSDRQVIKTSDQQLSANENSLKLSQLLQSVAPVCQCRFYKKRKSLLKLVAIFSVSLFVVMVTES